jgi:hypothetical protein
MKNFAILFIALLGTSAGTASALECRAPGTTVQWAMDQCLLEANSDDPTNPEVQKCLKEANPIKQPCEWNITYKERYCTTLINKGMFNGTVSSCVSDPNKIGPTVRKAIQECLQQAGTTRRSCMAEHVRLNAGA